MLYILNPTVRTEKTPETVLKDRSYSTFLFQSAAFFDLVGSLMKDKVELKEGEVILGVSVNENGFNVHFGEKNDL